MTAPNWPNRTLFHGDNLKFLRAMNSESVDLIATDPPFNKSKDFHATPDSLAKGAKFQDRWSWERDVHEEWTDQIRDDHPRLMEAIESARFAHSDGMGAFMCFIAVRLLEMRRLLKPTGSIYLHCDPTASHYLKAVMDAVFGWRNFRNEVLWLYKTGGMSKRWFGRKHDNILFYSRGKDYIFNPQKEKSYLSHKYGFSNVEILQDEHGSYTMVGMRDYWDIPALRGNQPETTGYPTQKPLQLYERIIKASSNAGDVVLDPFAGCATTCVAAERLGRPWVGIDLWEGAHQITLDRLRKEGLASTDGDSAGTLAFGQVHYVTEPPMRTDGGDTAAPFQLTPQRRNIIKEPWEKLSRKAMAEHLAEAQRAKTGEVTCAGCGRRLHERFMQLDHRAPRSGGGPNRITNRVLLCGPCNLDKRDTLTMPGLWKANRVSGWLHDEAAAKAANTAARDYADEIRTGTKSLKLIEHQGDQERLGI